MVTSAVLADIVISAVEFRQLLKSFALAAVLAGPHVTLAQLPPANVLLTEPRPALITLGPLDAHFRATASAIYDDNISLHDQPRTIGISTGDDDEPLGEDFIFTLSPGITLNKANTLEDSRTAFALDYSPSFLFFVKNPHANSIDHAARLKTGYAFTKLTLGLTYHFDVTSGGIVDVGDRVDQTRHRAGVSARYEMTEKTFLQADGTYSIQDYESLNDSEEWSFAPTANYQISAKITLGLGLTVGQLFVDEEKTVAVPTRTNDMGTVRPGYTNLVRDTTRQTFVGPMLRGSYLTTEKTTISASFGGEWRTYEDGSSSFGPVFSLDGTYQPRQGTRFTVGAHRREQNSIVINGANYVSTGVSLSARHELAHRLSGHVQFSYDNADYKPTRRGVETSREDDYFLLRYGLDAILGRSWTIGVFHQYRDNVSSDDSFSFSNNQVGIQAAWGY